MLQLEQRSAFKPLIGEEESTVDDKGRILVSKKKRDRLGEEFAMSLGDNGCLIAYPMFAWERMCREIDAAKAINMGRQQYASLLMGTAEDELTFDKQGRFVIPAKLRVHASIGAKVVLVGAYDRVEIWASEERVKYLNDMDGYGAERRAKIQAAYNLMLVQG